MLRRIGITTIALLLLSTLWPVAAQTITPIPIEFAQQSDPASVIGSYYNAITLGDYHRAYGYWESAPGNQTEAQFVAGFADTLSADVLFRLPIFEDAGAGNVYASVPTLLIANRKNGTQAYFAGCFTTHRTNVPVGNATEPDPNWYLQKATLKQQSSPNFVALDTACAQSTSLTDGLVPPNQLDPLQTLQSYYTMLATGGVSAAYWDDPTGDQVMQLYGKELTHQLSLDLFVNPQIYMDGAAGSVYAKIPALVMLNAPDGNHSYLSACYTARLSNVPVGNATEPDPNWHFSSVIPIGLTSDPLTAIITLAQGCTY